jgi:hypothetical protein
MMVTFSHSSECNFMLRSILDPDVYGRPDSEANPESKKGGETKGI